MTDPEQDDAERAERLGIHEFFRVLRRRWMLLVAVVGIVVGLVVGWSMAQTPKYLSYADVLIEPSVDASTASGSVEVSPEEVATQVQVVTSVPVADIVQNELGLTERPSLADWVIVEPQGNSRILRITAVDSDAEEAAEIANLVSRAYLSYRQEDSVRRYEQASQRLSRRQATIQGRLDAIDAELAKDPRSSVELDAERRSLLTQLGQVATQVAAVDQSMTTAAAGGAVLQEAVPGVSPVFPRTMFNGLLAGFFGLLLGAGAALLRDRFDDVVHDQALVRRSMPKAVALGRIPRWDEGTSKGRLITLMEPYSNASEAYQTLAVNARFLLATARQHGSGGRVVLVTSGQTGEGKTVTAANLGVAAARIGMSVVLVDADLRRPSIAQRFGLGDLTGLSDLLAGDASPESHLVDVGVPALRILPAGTIPPNPTALLASARMRQVLAELAEAADILIVDSSPALAVADALQLAGLADLTAVVARAGVSRRRELSSVTEALSTVGVDATAVVYNAVDGGGGSSSYGYPPRGASADTGAEDVEGAPGEDLAPDPMTDAGSSARR